MKLIWTFLLCVLMSIYSYAQDPVIAWQKQGQNQCDLFIVSPNGKRVGTSSNVDVTIKMWDIETGKHLGTGAFASPYSNLIYPSIDTLAFTPHGSQLDGSIATLWPYYRASSWTERRPFVYLAPNYPKYPYEHLQSAILWDEERILYRYDTSINRSILLLLDPQGKQLNRWYLQERDLSGIVSSPDTHHFALRNVKTGEAVIFNIESGTEVRRIKGRYIYSCCFSLDGKYLITEADTNVVQVWDWEADTVINTLYLDPGNKIFSNDRAYVLQNYQIIRTIDGVPVFSLDDAAGYSSIALAHDGNTLRIVYQNEDFFDSTRQVYIVDINTPIVKKGLFDNYRELTGLAFAQGSRYLVSTHYNMLKVWDVASRQLVNIKRLEKEVTCLTTALNGNDVFIGYKGSGDIERYDAATLTRNQVYQPDLAPNGSCYYIKETSNGKMFALFENDTNLYIFDAVSGSFVERKPLPIDGLAFGAIDISHDGKKVVIGSFSWDNTWIYDIEEMNLKDSIVYERALGLFNQARYSKDDSKIFVAWSYSDYVETFAFAEYNFFSLDNRTLLFTTYGASVNGCTLNRCEWNSDNKFIYATSSDIAGGVWNKLGAVIRIGMDSARQVFQKTMPSAQYALAVSQDEKEYLATGGLDGTITLWCTQDCRLGVPRDQLAPIHAKFYPNPSSDVVTLTFAEDLPAQPSFRIFDLLGVGAFAPIEILTSNEVRLDIRSLPDGIYVLRSLNYPLLSAKFIKVSK